MRDQALMTALWKIVANRIEEDALDTNKSCGVVSTYRLDQSDQANQSCLTGLQELAEGLGFEVSFLKGFWSEGEDRFEEQSLFLVADPGDSEDLFEFLQDASDIHAQDGFLFRPEGEKITQYHSEEGVEDLGEFHLGRFGDFYSKIKGKPFTFV